MEAAWERRGMGLVKAVRDGNTREQSTGHMHEDSMRKPITLCADLKR